MRTKILTTLIFLLISCFSAQYGQSQDILVNDKSGDTVGIASHSYIYNTTMSLLL